MDLYKDGVCSSLRHALVEFERSIEENRDKRTIERWRRRIDFLVDELERIEELERKSR